MTIVFDEPVNSAMPCRPLPPFCASPRFPARERPKVLILDTGLSTLRSGAGPAHPYLQDAVKIHPGWRDDTDPLAPDDEDEEDADQNRRLDLQSGHGTFVVGLIRRLCPDARSTSTVSSPDSTTSDDDTCRSRHRTGGPPKCGRVAPTSS